MSGIAEVLVTQGYARVGLRSRRERGHAPPRQAGRDDRASATPRRTSPSADAVVVSDGGGRRQSGSRRGARARHPRGAARADAGRADAPEAGHRHRRHARQDDDHEPHRLGARRRRPRPDVRHRRAAPVRRCQRAPRQGRVPGRRGRRVGRVVPVPHAGARGGHQHRRRPHGDVRARLREAHARVRRLPAAAAVLRRGRGLRRRCATCARSCPDVTKPLVTYGLADDADLRAIDVVNVGGRMRFVAQRQGLRRTLPSSWRCPACTTCATRSRRSPSGARSASPTRRSPRRCPNSAAWAAASSATATSRSKAAATFTLIDDYGHHPVEMTATLEAARASFPGPPPGARVPAASLHAHARPVRGFRARAVDRRRAGARRRLSRGRSADRRGRRPRARARRARRRQGRAGVRRGHRATCRRRCARSCATATSS